MVAAQDVLGMWFKIKFCITDWIWELLRDWLHLAT